MTAGLEGGEWSAVRPGRTLPLGKTRYWMLGGTKSRSRTDEKSRPQRNSIPDRPSRSSVAIPTELRGPRVYVCNVRNSAYKVHVHVPYYIVVCGVFGCALFVHIISGKIRFFELKI